MSYRLFRFKKVLKTIQSYYKILMLKCRDVDAFIGNLDKKNEKNNNRAGALVGR
jgi:hypothetical protein